MGLGGEVVTEVAEGGLDGPEDLIVGEIDQFVHQTLQEGIGLAAEGRTQLLPPLFASESDRGRDRGGFNEGFKPQGHFPRTRPG
jgi:hypothetical protein